MNLRNLFIGKILKSYREMCSILGEERKTGNAKIAQLKEWERYFKYRKDGNKFIIEEIYNTPLEKVDGRKKRISRIYDKDLQLLIMHTLVKNMDINGKVFYGINTLLKNIGMVNINYRVARYNIDDYALYKDIPKANVKEFFHYNHKNLTRNVVTALNQLQDKSLINWSVVTMVVKREFVCKKNELDEPMIRQNQRTGKFEIDSNTQLEVRKATFKELKIIQEVEAEVLEIMNLKGKKYVYYYDRWKEFAERMDKKLEERANIVMSYNAYEIICNEKYIKKRYAEELEKNPCVMELFAITDRITTKVNKKTQDVVKENSIKRKADFKGIGIPKEDIKKALISNNYFNYYDIFIDELIDTNAINIEYLIKNEAYKSCPSL